MSIMKEFKEFAMRGNVVDLATGVIIGGAFGKIVSSMVADIIMPVISIVTGKMDFANMFYSLDGKDYATLQLAKDAGVSTINYGIFLTNIIDFVVIAFTIFLIIKKINSMKKAPAAAAAEVTTKNCPFCQSVVHIKAVRCPNCTSELK